MATVSRLNPAFTMGDKVEMRLPVHPWHWDHHFNGKTILAAVEIMQTLATVARERYPEIAVKRMTNARFTRFLEIPAETAQIAVIAQVEEKDPEKTKIFATLQSRVQMKTTSRLLNHAELCFGCAGQENPPPPGKEKGKKQFPVQISAAQVYAELVPFGPCYRSLRGAVSLHANAVQAMVRTPDYAVETGVSGLPRPLGSSFPLDGAMHAACVHGQSQVDFVPFPVGFAQRTIHCPTDANTCYAVEAVLRGVTGQELVYDLWLADSSGALCETVLGLRMRDVSRGAIRPPAWLRQWTLQ